MTAPLVLLDNAFHLDLPPPLDTAVRTAFPLPPAGPAPRLPPPGPQPVPVRLRVDGLAVLLDGQEHARAPTAATLLETVLGVLNAATIDGCSSFAVHAGVVARDGVAIAWPGVSGAGKSTLTAACLREGLDYVSDEALVLQGDRVRPYPRPLSLSAWSLAAVGLPGPLPGTSERAVAPAELRAGVPERPVRLGHLVVLERRAGPAELEQRTPAAVAMLLLQHSFNHYRQPEEAFRTASAAAATARCWTLRYETPRDGARLLAGL